MSDTQTDLPSEPALASKTPTDTPRAPTPATPASPDAVTNEPNWLVIIVATLVAVAAVFLILYAWELPPFTSTVQRTEDAYVHGEVVTISPQVSGYVSEVLVKDFAYVKAGQPLFRIDERLYRQHVEEAQATLAAREADLANSAQSEAAKRAAVASRDAEVASAQAQAARAQADMTRVSGLAADGSLSLRERDQATATLRETQAAVVQAQSNREVARQDVVSVGVARKGLVAAVEGARAALRRAEIDLSKTVILAPEAGQVGQIGTRRGQSVAAGTQLVSLVPPRLWIIANYKERQAGPMAPGQPASFTVDALADQRLSGRVEQISPATGSNFSVLPAQNATGNFTKVAQRLPVRIIINSNQPGFARLRPGMSVVAYVDTATGTQR